MTLGEEHLFPGAFVVIGGEAIRSVGQRSANLGTLGPHLGPKDFGLAVPPYNPPMGDLLGIFGGTFDPPHLGHLALASQAQFCLGLDRVLWVLTPRPPHKEGAPVTPLRHRFKMLQLAIAKNEDFEISSVEMDRPGPHYTVDTLRILASRWPAAGLVYLMGSDRMQGFTSWNGSAEITAMCRFLGVQPRPGNLVELGQLEHANPDVAAKVRLLDAPMLQISSRDIRVRRAQGRPLRYLLPAPVFEYIVKNRLYL